MTDNEKLKVLNERVTTLEARLAQAITLLGALTEEIIQANRKAAELGQKYGSTAVKLNKIRNDWKE